MDNGTRFIGLCVIDPDVAFEAAGQGGLTEAWLPFDWQRQALTAMKEMRGKGLPIDSHFVADYAEKNGYLVSIDEIDGAISAAPSRRNGADGLIAALKSDHVQRELERMSEQMYHQSKKDPVGLAASLANELLELAGNHAADETKDSVLDEIRHQWRESLAGNLPGLPIPWSRYASQVGGPRRKMVTTVVGHGGSGKSSLFLQWALHLGKQGIPCLVMPFEDGTHVAYERLAGMEAQIPVFGVHVGLAREDHVERLDEALEYVSKLPIHIASRRGSIGEITIEAQQHKAKHGVQAVFVDAFKDVRKDSPGIEGENDVMAGIVDMAHRLDMPVILGHHVRKAPSALKGNAWESWHISKDDLRGTGRIWDDSRAVWALQMHPIGDERDQQFEYSLQCLKSNHGIAGVVQPVMRTKWGCWTENTATVEI